MWVSRVLVLAVNLLQGHEKWEVMRTGEWVCVCEEKVMGGVVLHHTWRLLLYPHFRICFYGNIPEAIRVCPTIEMVFACTYTPLRC